MKAFNKHLISLFFVLLLAAGAAWIVLPQGNRINLKSIGINYEKKFKINLGLDLQGGSHLEYKAKLDSVPESDRSAALEAVRNTIEKRVNSFGVSEPVIQVQGKDKIIVELPGIKDVNEAINQIGQTPLLEFKTEAPQTEYKTVIGPDGQPVVDPTSAWKSTELTGKQLKRALVDVQQGQGQLQQEIVVKLEFNDEGKDLFAKITKENLNKSIAIFINNELVSAPTVNAVITDGVAIISGAQGFTKTEAQNLVNQLNSGALPVPIELVSQQTVGATLGQSSMDKSLVAGVIGLIIIALFMMAYYRFPGLLAVLALGIYVLLSLAIFKVGISPIAIIISGLFFLLSITVNRWFGVLALVAYAGFFFAGNLTPITLTLAGIAGFILSIGMAVDANILIFERIKEELRNGKTVHQAVEDGFNRAWLSIRDSNASSLITTLVLYYFGTPSIKGFAVTLSIGIFISMFTAISITRTLMRIFLGNWLSKHPGLLLGAKPLHDQPNQIQPTEKAV